MEFSVDATLSQVLNSKTRYPISQRQRGRPVVESNGCRVTNRAVEGSLTCAAEKERGKKAEGGGDSFGWLALSILNRKSVGRRIFH